MYGIDDQILEPTLSDPICIIRLLINEYKDISWVSYLNILLEPQFHEILRNGVLTHGELENTFKNLIKSCMDFDSEFSIRDGEYL
jgi:hypothetical protein